MFPCLDHDQPKLSEKKMISLTFHSFYFLSSFVLFFAILKKTEYAEYVNLKKIADRAKEGMLRNLRLGDDGCSCRADHDRVDDRGVRGDHEQRSLE